MTKLKENMGTRKTLLKQLNETIAQLLGVFREVDDSAIAVCEDWTARDVLGHIVFWHESFARNVSDLINGIKPTPLKGRFIDLNQHGVEEMRKYTLEQVTEKLEVAHRTIQENILSPKLTLIPYKKGSRDYTPEEHLDIVNEHIKEHLRGITRLLQHFNN